MSLQHPSVASSSIRIIDNGIFKITEAGQLLLVINPDQISRKFFRWLKYIIAHSEAKVLARTRT